MIRFKQVKKYCCEDFSLIENYEEALSDKINTWDCHHRIETELGFSKKVLIENGLYWDRPACELIFLTKSEHSSLHGKNRTPELRYRMGSGNRGKHFSEEHKSKISASNKGKKKSDEARSNMSKAKSGKFVGEKNHSSKQVQQIDKKTGEILKIWPCVMDVQRQLNINQGHISECCLGKRKSAGGYVWKYC